mmetsp:Transcript_23672/g.55149  ORF Transcript_23672/g.55149 Transcript_23672/m.55149 type:complete len:235 (+) Transcript_23672:205-909(+)
MQSMLLPVESLHQVLLWHLSLGNLSQECLFWSHGWNVDWCRYRCHLLWHGGDHYLYGLSFVGGCGLLLCGLHVGCSLHGRGTRPQHVVCRRTGGRRPKILSRTVGTESRIGQGQTRGYALVAWYAQNRCHERGRYAGGISGPLSHGHDGSWKCLATSTFESRTTTPRRGRHAIWFHAKSISIPSSVGSRRFGRLSCHTHFHDRSRFHDVVFFDCRFHSCICLFVHVQIVFERWR